MKKILSALVMAFCCVTATPTFAQYVEPQSVKLTQNLADDYGVKAKGSSDIAPQFQKAIDYISAKGGGKLTVPKGDYLTSGIAMKSNVQVEIEAGTVFRPFFHGNAKRFVMFEFGGQGTFIENVSICGVGGRFDIIVPENKQQAAPFTFKNVHNFKVSNVNIEDVKTHFPIMTFSPCENNDEKIFGPTNGLITDATATNCHYGYGLVQAHCGRNIHFENLDGIGGVTLRFETGAADMNDRQFGGIFNMTAKNISCTNGNSAVMIAPHSMHNGVVQIDGVTAVSCGFAVRTEGSYVSKKYTTEGLTGGSFAEGCYVKNVTATFGNKAQLKSKHFRYMPEELLKDIQPVHDNYCSDSPSIAAVLDAKAFPCKFENVKAIGFLNDAIVTEDAPRSAAYYEAAKKAKAASKKK